MCECVCVCASFVQCVRQTGCSKPVSLSSSGSLVRPKVVRSVHYCPATKKTMERKYTDMTSLDAFPSSAIYPTKVTILVSA